MWNGGKEVEIENFFRGWGGGEVVLMEGLFFLVGFGVWSKGCKVYCYYINFCYFLFWKICDWGESVLFLIFINNLKKFMVFVI